ncbi:MFS transporter [Serratia nevei]|uniref:MFS transporter n=1 Tax=Serratia nevei TaxID=2703794 RepID=UPI003FA6A7AA
MKHSKVLTSTTAPTGMRDDALPRAKMATRLAFFIAGFGLSCWAPMVPYAQTRIGAGSAELGSVLLCLGLGSVIGMPATGWLAGRLGSCVVIISGSIGLSVALPLLAVAPTSIVLGAALFLFGLSLGAIDVAANVQAAEIQRNANEPLMSGFHGLYSVGGLIGASAMTAPLSFGMDVTMSAVIASVIILASIVIASSRFLATRAEGGHPPLMIPHGIVVLLGVMALLTFLVEGAVLDWGAILLVETQHVPVDNAGSGYVVFALAMTITRLAGDRFVGKVGNRKTLAIGAVLTCLGVTVAAWTKNMALSLCGFCLAGIGVANIVPVLFILAATQKVMPVGYAIAVTSTLGYLGVFAGPAAIGHVASLTGLPVAFGALAVLMVVIAGLADVIVRSVLGAITRP